MVTSRAEFSLPQLIEGPKNPAAEGHFTVTAKLGPTTMTSAMSCSLFLPHCMIRQITIENHRWTRESYHCHKKWVLSFIPVAGGVSIEPSTVISTWYTYCRL
jgi:hypothetical protein